MLSQTNNFMILIIIKRFALGKDNKKILQFHIFLLSISKIMLLILLIHTNPIYKITI